MTVLLCDSMIAFSKATTVAPTEAKAKSNLAYRYKKENGLMPNTKITLPGKLIPA